MKSTDKIWIRGLEVSCCVGVPDAERAQAQTLRVNVTMHPLPSEEPLRDDINRTVDYYAVSLRILKVAQERPRQLIETLAEDMAACVLAEFNVSGVVIEIEKFILPNTRCVGVTLHRER